MVSLDPCHAKPALMLPAPYTTPSFVKSKKRRYLYMTRTVRYFIDGLYANDEQVLESSEFLERTLKAAGEAYDWHKHLSVQEIERYRSQF